MITHIRRAAAHPPTTAPLFGSAKELERESGMLGVRDTLVSLNIVHWKPHNSQRKSVSGNTRRSTVLGWRNRWFGENLVGGKSASETYIVSCVCFVEYVVNYARESARPRQLGWYGFW